MNDYINQKGELLDEKIIEDLREAADMYENGEIIETMNRLIDIYDALNTFFNNN